MKNRQKFTVSEKSLLSQIERLDKEVDRRFLELRAKKKIASNPLIVKNLAFLQSYNKAFGTPVQPTGDADTCFRKSLRNYSSSLDIIKELYLDRSSLLKVKKPRSIFTKASHHRCEHQEDFSSVKLKKLVDQQSSSVNELFSKEVTVESESDSEGKDFFSPLEELQPEDERSQEASKDHPVRVHKLPLPEEAEQQDQHLNKSIPLDIKEPLLEEPEEENFSPRLQVPDKLLNQNDSSSEEDNLVSARAALESIYRMAEEFAGEEMESEFQSEMENEYSDDELKDVEEMIQQASEELQKVAEENQEMMETLEEGDEEDLLNVTEPHGPVAAEAAGDSVFKFDPAIDAAVLKELEEAEKQAKATAKVITELKNRVGELLQKEKMTEAEAKELEDKNKELKTQMMLFEEKTKRIQALLGQANLFDKMVPIQPPLQTKHAEDILPKMLVCGRQDEYMPKIVLCTDNKERCRSRSPSKGRNNLGPMAQKLNESYNLQEKLVCENVNLEGTRYQLQSDLRNKDQTVDSLQRQLCCLQNEMKMVYQENAALNEKLQACPNPSCPKNSRSNSPTRGGGGSCGPGRGICPADVENRLQEYSNTTNQLEKQIVDVEQEVRMIQQELLEVQKEREHLEHHRRMLAIPVPCPGGMPSPCPPMSSCPYPPPPCGYPPCPRPPCFMRPPPPPCCPPEASGEDQQYKELKEKYSRLQEDFKAKLTEVAGLRADNEKLKELAEKAEETRTKLELKVKELEKKLKDLRGDGDKGVGSKEQLIDLQQQLKVHKELYRQAQDELEELRALVEDIQGQLNDYRNKYLEAIQTVEEQRRQIEIMRLENNRVSEQVNLEIVRVKNQFQEKLQELAPLPDILKATQVKLQEAQQMHLLAERNNESLARELQTYKDKLQEYLDEMALADSDKAAGAGEKEQMAQKIKDLEQALTESKNENDDLLIEIDRTKELADENERLANEKLHEIAQLEAQLENVREESARQVARIKDRCEIVRKSQQNQINDLERQLAQTKAAAKAAEKDRDQIREKMQAQIRNLNENFDDAQMRIRNLQGHVNFMKNSYLTPSELNSGDRKAEPKADPCCCSAEY
ncbi:myosin-9 [Anthonomus grandis grandis]|uniref:myosin-9 n=1 Tax=Anthonomus grandis grandis TaxID=2921223 RepID=UPI0021656C6A|nr:myosin-9 [Anthonomus grandis grandis]